MNEIFIVCKLIEKLGIRHVILVENLKKSVKAIRQALEQKKNIEKKGLFAANPICEQQCLCLSVNAISSCIHTRTTVKLLAKWQ